MNIKEINIKSRVYRVKKLETKNILIVEKKYQDLKIYSTRYVQRKSIKMLSLNYYELIGKVEGHKVYFVITFYLYRGDQSFRKSSFINLSFQDLDTKHLKKVYIKVSLMKINSSREILLLHLKAPQLTWTICWAIQQRSIQWFSSFMQKHDYKNNYTDKDTFKSL